MANRKAVKAKDATGTPVILWTEDVQRQIDAQAAEVERLTIAGQEAEDALNLYEAEVESREPLDDPREEFVTRGAEQIQLDRLRRASIAINGGHIETTRTLNVQILDAALRNPEWNGLGGGTREVTGSLQRAKDKLADLRAVLRPERVRFAQLFVDRATPLLAEVHIGTLLRVVPQTTGQPDHDARMTGGVQLVVESSLNPRIVFPALRDVLASLGGHLEGDTRSLTYGWAGHLVDVTLKAERDKRRQAAEPSYHPNEQLPRGTRP